MVSPALGIVDELSRAISTFNKPLEENECVRTPVPDTYYRFKLELMSGSAPGDRPCISLT